MKSKRIFAAALAGMCAVSTMGVSAFAEKVESAGAKSYKVSAGFQAPTIDVTVPEEIAAVINPYMIEVKLDNLTYEAEGIASPKYTITNNSAEVGINVKATYSAEGLDGLVASKDAAVKTDDANNKDKKKLAYVTLNAESPLDVTATDTTASATGAVNTLEFSADTTAPEKTDVLMRLNVAAAGATDNAGDFWIGGAVIEEPAEKWATSDKLSINVVLDINPFNTGNTTQVVVTYPAGMTAAAKYTGTGTFAGDGATYTLSCGTSGTISIDLAAADKANGRSITSVASNATSVVMTSSTTVMITGAGNATLTYTLDNGSTFTVAVTAA